MAIWKMEAHMGMVTKLVYVFVEFWKQGNSDRFDGYNL